MRVVVTGASGNVGTSVLRALAGEAAVTSVLGLAGRRPEIGFAKTTWATADVAADDVGQAYRLAVVGDAPARSTWPPTRCWTPTPWPGCSTPPLDPRAGGPLRPGEFRTGVGGGA